VLILLGGGAAPAAAASELLKGSHFTVDAKVPIKDFMARFTIRSPFGTFTAYGLRMLPIRVNEVEALAKLDEVSKTREFTAAVGRAAGRPVTSAVNMITRPVETISGFPDGAAWLFGRIRLAGERTAEVSRRVGMSTITALGFEQERRRLAERLGVDP
jgi:hypothetical protein